eukprot:TRINITY_DN2256_c0_g1_i1.p1 TRINITY_DN2256_c0_g1~~TRINITY_DN2256_c0_g1_i1.p1  ORF type:complete len:163 (+),score=44.00 TRINITY_DN2256_c0_g1_i1:57-545(+)
MSKVRRQKKKYSAGINLIKDQVKTKSKKDNVSDLTYQQVVNDLKNSNLSKKSKKLQKRNILKQKLEIQERQREEDLKAKEEISLESLLASIQTINQNKNSNKAKEFNRKKPITSKQRTRILSTAGERLDMVLNHPVFLDNPTMTINEHLKNSINMQKRELEQ